MRSGGSLCTGRSCLSDTFFLPLFSNLVLTQDFTAVKGIFLNVAVQFGGRNAEILLDEDAVEGRLVNYLVVHQSVEILIEGDCLQSRLLENVGDLYRDTATLDIDVDAVQVVRPEPYCQIGECQ